MPRLLWIVVVLAFAVPTAGAAAAILVQAPPGQIRTEAYEVVPAPPSSTIGSIEQSVDYFTAGGASGEVPLPDAGEAIIGRRQFAGPGGTGSPSVLGFAFTSSSVAAVSVDGGAPIATVPGVGQLEGLSSALYEIPGVSLGSFDLRANSRLHVLLTAFAANGQPITTPAPGASAPENPALETRSWEAPAAASLGVCQIAARHGSGFAALSGSVVAILRPIKAAFGKPYVTCAQTRYRYRGASATEPPLTSFMVLDAEHPGVEPAAMPAMEPLPGDPGIFQSRPSARNLIGRRIHGAWLLVEEGSSLQERVALLADLRAGISLPAPVVHHRVVRKHRG